MTTPDIRGFDYPLEPVHQLAHHRVDAAVAELGARQRALQAARQRLQDVEEQCRALAGRGAPVQASVIDPRRAMAVLHRLQQLGRLVAEAERAVAGCEADVARAQRALEQACTRREAFDLHRQKALQVHLQAVAARQQSAADQDWLARTQVLPSAADHTPRGGPRP